MTCAARQYSDQMCCGRCGLQWDVNDPEPPVCMSSAQAVHPARREYVAFVKAVFNVEAVKK